VESWFPEAWRLWVQDYGLLEAARARPQATAFGKDAYPDLDAKAATLLHSIARNHALIDSMSCHRE
jgi:death-on-curing protein